MPRHLDLGNDVDIAVGGITKHFAHIVRRIEHPLAIRLSVIFLTGPGMPDDSLGTHGTDLGKPRIFTDRQPPTLIIGQMPMKRIDLMQRKDVDITLHLLHAAEMTANVEHHTPIGKKGLILDPKRRNHRSALPGAAGNDLTQRLHGMDRPAGRSGREVDALS